MDAPSNPYRFVLSFADGSETIGYLHQIVVGGQLFDPNGVLIGQFVPVTQ